VTVEVVVVTMSVIRAEEVVEVEVEVETRDVTMLLLLQATS
jgi:hypothetical protein